MRFWQADDLVNFDVSPGDCRLSTPLPKNNRMLNGLKSAYDRIVGRHPSVKLLGQRVMFPVIDVLCHRRGLFFPRNYPRWSRVTAALGRYDADEMMNFRAYRHFVRQGDTILDIGANVGIHTRILADLTGPHGRVFAFEPTPELFTCLESNTRNFNNCTCIRKAVCGEDGNLDFGIHAHSCTSNALVTARAAPVATIEVNAVSLDAWTNRTGITKVHLVKIDVEGAECAVLTGAATVIAANPDIVFMIEYCPDNLANFGISPGDYFETIRRLGLQCCLMGGDGNIRVITSVVELESVRGVRPFINILAMGAKPAEMT